MNYSAQYVQSFGTLVAPTNPFEELYGIGVVYDASNPNNISTSIELRQLSIKESGYSPQLCQAQSAVCRSSTWVITRYVAQNRSVAQSNSGPLVSIQDRGTGQYLAPVGFTPGFNYDLGLIRPPVTDPRTTPPHVDLTLVTDLSNQAPGAWWYLYPGGIGPCIDDSSGFVDCVIPPQLVFVSGWQFFDQPSLTFAVLVTMASISYYPNLGYLENVPPPPTGLGVYPFQVNYHQAPGYGIDENTTFFTEIISYGEYVSRVNADLSQKSQT
jgi:hypothetical protein